MKVTTSLLPLPDKKGEIFPCYANILDHLENIRDKKILIVGRKRLTSWV